MAWPRKCISLKTQHSYVVLVLSCHTRCPPANQVLWTDELCIDNNINTSEHFCTWELVLTAVFLITASESLHMDSSVHRWELTFSTTL